jgi:hypothetical protein
VTTRVHCVDSLKSLYSEHTEVHICFGVLTIMPPRIMICRKFDKGISMNAKYQTGQKVTITPLENQLLSPRDSNIEPYVGKVGKVIDYYWICPNTGEVFYIYTVQIEADQKEIVVYEDELEAYLE